MAQDERRAFSWKKFFSEIFVWWQGQTWGTRRWVWMNGVYVGSDEFGNRYYRGKKRGTGATGFERRMVLYNGYAEPSMIPPGWHGWMHHRVDVAPSEETYVARDWQKPHIGNETGSSRAYRPDGSILAGGERPRVTGDYDAWSPE